MPSPNPRLRTIALLAVALLACVPAAVPAAPAGPAAPAAPLAVSLDRIDGSLQRGLEAAIDRLGARQLVRDGRMAVAVVDLGRSQPRVATINGDRMLYAASLPKIAILAGAFDALEHGTLQDSPELRDEMTRMIRVSDNRAATDVLHRVGFESVAATLQSPDLRLYDERRGGLWVGKAYGQDDYWRRDPIAQLSHGATARQVARFFVLLEQGQLISAQASRQMKQILGNPGIRHKFVRGLEARPGARIYRKSGTWRDFHSDAALVERSDAKYVVVGLVQSPDGSRLLERLAVQVDDLIRRPAGTRVAAVGR